MKCILSVCVFLIQVCYSSLLFLRYGVLTEISVFSVKVCSWARRVLCAVIGCDSAGSHLRQTWSDFSHTVDHVAGALADVSYLADVTRAHGYSGSGSAVGHRTHQFPSKNRKRREGWRQQS